MKTIGEFLHSDPPFYAITSGNLSWGEKTMRKINIKDIAEESWTSPKGKFGGASKEISVALGRKPSSTDLNERYPFDIEICRIPPGKSHCPFHSHSAQWEFYTMVKSEVA